MTKEERKLIENYLQESKYLLMRFDTCRNWQDLVDGIATLTNGVEKLLEAQVR